MTMGMGPPQPDAAAPPGTQPEAAPLRILHIGKFYPPDLGGMETYLADLMAQQRGDGVDARALVHGTPRADDPPWLRRLRVHIRLIFTPIALGFPWAIARSLKTFCPDVLHLHMPNVAVFWLLLSRRARRIPWVVHWHSDVTFQPQQRALALAYRLYRPFEQAVLAHARFVIATSPPYLQASAALRDWRDKCVAIPLGLQQQAPTPQGALPQATTNATNTADATAATPWTAGRLRILSVGRLTYYKGFETLARAIAARPDMQLRIVGDGDLRQSLQALIEQLHAQGQSADIQLLGSVSEARKHQLLAECDVFALASRERTEAFGLALLEAMQFGKPCVVSDLPGSGMPWLIRQSHAGLCVPMDDLSAWRAALQQLHRDASLRARLGQAGQRAARQLFSISANSQHVHSLYTSLMPESQAAQQRATLLAVPMRHMLTVSELDALAQRLHAICAALQPPAQWVLMNEADGGRDVARFLTHWGQARGIAVLHLPQQRSHRLGSLQAALRWALRQGHERLLYLPAPLVQLASQAQAWPALGDAILSLLQQAGSAAPGRGSAQQAAHILQAKPLPGRRDGFTRQASRWLAWLSRARLSPSFDQSLWLLQRPAMQKAHQMRLSLLDQPEMGLLLMARHSGLGIEQLSLPVLNTLPPAPRRPWWQSAWQALNFALGSSLMYLVKRRPRAARR
ncbi:glycosyl transferase family 1 [Vandammella animalimorsus]|uniref:Glycosyl transferase family 1 n=2 Tax=Vandammella animalimorsus TaxID=2029117 RepID=A0A2A2B0R6_9BURK|nr:glycosyl transferase family 1 [Vandammella animalimorsus]